MGLAQHKPRTADEYFNDTSEDRWELLDGEAYDMSPAPSLRHQALSGRMHMSLAELAQRRCGGGEPPNICQVFAAPVDVRLNDLTVVQPDLVVVCDPAKLANGHYVDGAPDLVVEILSLSTAKKDRQGKRLAYQAAGVAEYLIVDPVADTVEQYLLENGVYPAPNVFAPGDNITLRLNPSWNVPVAEWFAE